MESPTPPIREIPYNYTSFSDREIVLRFLGRSAWESLETLRTERRTGRSARLLFEILGDLWVVTRNPFIEDDLLNHPRRLASLLETLRARLELITTRAQRNTRVLGLVKACEQAVEEFAEGFPRLKTLREKARRVFSRVTRADNIDFSSHARISHATDATDWRVAYPFVVLTPDRADEVANLVVACGELGLTIIPRGGGTGYTGSAIPLFPDTAVINTEKLTHIHEPRRRRLPGVDEAVWTIEVEAGAITKRVAEIAEAAGLIFAVDPTSQSASTIGGNIAMNSGGKKAVRWGTALDNLASWRQVTATGDWLEVVRLDHNLGKIHALPEARFQVTRFGRDGVTREGDPLVLTIPRERIRKSGLGKDVTDKALGGLPGVQKEGCDGLITSAIFVLHRMPTHTRTVCLEFFDRDIGRAVPAIVEIKNRLDTHPQAGCAGLEHMDERYLRAVGYSTKASRGGRPKMVLLVDVIGEEAEITEAAAAEVVALATSRGGEGFIASSREGRDRFWADRSRVAAIAAHTNAFKVNEDVVIPLERLAEYSAGIERINLEQAIANKLRMLSGVRDFLQGEGFSLLAPADSAASDEGAAIVERKVAVALARLEAMARRWQGLLQHLDDPAAEHPELLGELPPSSLTPGDRVVEPMLRRDFKLSYRREIEGHLEEVFSGDQWTPVRGELQKIQERIRGSRLFVAMHMHAGDGNVHTNIPVNSNDYEMLREAERVVARIMALALSLGGSISGEHGIGLTKFHFLDPAKVADFARYKAGVDPEGRFNRGKLLAGSSLELAYTPSLRLVQQEALILEESALGALNDKVRNCLRCGKCKPVCSTHVPRANLLYSPRNKILTGGLIIEAFLYEEQTGRGLSRHHFAELQDVADHCTVCHRCLTPCPVKIDFGQVTMEMRAILKERGRGRMQLGSRLARGFLTTSDPRAIRWLRRAVLQPGFALQRWVHRLALPALTLAGGERPPGTTGASPGLRNQLTHLLATPLPGNLSSGTARTALGVEDPRFIPIVGATGNGTESMETLFFFPGCGSERLFGDIALAALALLDHAGVRTALPPGYLCCGYPQTASGDRRRGRWLVMHNRVVLHRMATVLKYLEIKTVLVSCGTCLKQMGHYGLESIFPGCRVMDVHEYLMEKGVTSPPRGEGFLFHDPCHSPSRIHPPLAVAERLLGDSGILTDRCCGEAGLFALARPDIATQVRFSKSASLRQGLAQVHPSGIGRSRSTAAKDPGRSPESIAIESQMAAPNGGSPSPESMETRTSLPPIDLRSGVARVQTLTTCPSCLQGLGRYRRELAVAPAFLAVELARRLLGPDWRGHFLDRVRSGKAMEKVLL
ncbi:MAG: DUF3683 domain-containing protein [Magnetococcales bacterium]|nr:DUF3683 domain-containing protein [Magnetococcales bacterium]